MPSAIQIRPISEEALLAAWCQPRRLGMGADEIRRELDLSVLRRVYCWRRRAVHKALGRRRGWVRLLLAFNEAERSRPWSLAQAPSLLLRACFAERR